MIRQILEDVANGVIERTPYRRVLVSLYEQPITSASDSGTRVLEYAARGLEPEDEREVLLFIAGGGIVRGEKFQPAFRLGDSYYLPAGSAPYSIVPRVPSRRRFINPHGWHADDLLLVPCRVDGKVIGQISVDDPCDGARPTREGLRGLEELASVAAIALDEARHRERLSERHRLFHFLTEHAMTGILITQAGRFCYANDRALELFGYPREELLAMGPWWQLFHPKERGALSGGDERPLPVNLEVQGIRKDGGTIWLKLQILSMEYQSRPALLLNLLDISDRVRTEVLLKEKALRDPLTGLFNRHYFDDTIQTELTRSQRYKRPFTLMMTDLAGFKRVNDRLGHQEGDQILRDIARMIQEQLRESDWAIRYGGDEFLIVLPETGVRIEVLAQRLRTVVDQWSATHLTGLTLGIDIGWATWTPEDNPSISRLLQLADTNMYAEKTER